MIKLVRVWLLVKKMCMRFFRADTTGNYKVLSGRPHGGGLVSPCQTAAGQCTAGLRVLQPRSQVRWAVAVSTHLPSQPVSFPPRPLYLRPLTKFLFSCFRQGFLFARRRGKPWGHVSPLWLSTHVFSSSKPYFSTLPWPQNSVLQIPKELPEPLVRRALSETPHICAEPPGPPPESPSFRENGSAGASHSSGSGFLLLPSQ